MNNFSKLAKKYKAAQYLFAAFCLIIGIAAKTTLQHTAAGELSHGIYWFFFTVAILAIMPRRTHRKTNRILFGVAFVLLVLFWSFYAKEGLYSLVGILTAVVLYRLITSRRDDHADTTPDTK
jgi:asparagine N-glycosylation enzyme membrane subunit Stt3